MTTTQEQINKTHKEGVGIWKKIRGLLVTERRLEKLNAKRRLELENLHPHGNIIMFDSVDVSQIPSQPVAVAGYVGGHWPTIHELYKKYPHAKKLSIAVNKDEIAECLDVEKGDAEPKDAVMFVRRERMRVKRPCVYADRSTMPQVINALNAAGIDRSGYRLWEADVTDEPHINEDVDACQWTFTALHKNLDQSLCRGNFFDA